MRLERLRFELGMKLATEIPGMIFDLANFHIGAIGRFARDPEAMRGQYLLEFAIELEPVPMALADSGGAIGPVGEAVRFQNARPRSQPHSAAEFIDTFQLAQLVDYALGSGWIELG